MASGDTKTQQYLDAAANGTRADLPAESCCETRTQSLIREVAERIMDVEDEVERLENNPDVVDIVDTYADLQAYSTSGLTDKDVIRVITDETQGGLSSYYRWNSPNPGWNFVGVIPGGGGIKELSSADYNYPTADPDRVALWLLDNGLYTAPAGVMVAASTTSYPWYNTSDKTILVGGSDTVKGIYTFLNGKTDVVTTQASDGTEADEYTLFKSTQVLQATGQSTTDTMSQKAITDAISGGGGDNVRVLTTADYNYPTDNPSCVALWLLEPGIYSWEGDVAFRGNVSWTDQTNSPGVCIIWDAGDGQLGTLFFYKGGERWYQLLNPTNGESYWTNRGLLNTAVFQGGNYSKVRIGSNASSTGDSSIAIGTSAASTHSSSIAIGRLSSATTHSSIAIGGYATVSVDNGVIAIGGNTSAHGAGSIALGRYSHTTQQGEMNIGSYDTNYGYNDSQYRLLTGLYDPQSDHDAATKGYVDSLIATLEARIAALEGS